MWAKISKRVNHLCNYNLIFKQFLRTSLNNCRLQSSKHLRRSATRQNSDFGNEHYYIEQVFSKLSVQSFPSLTKDDETARKVEMILNEYEFLKYTTSRVPTTLCEPDMRDLLSARSYRQRKRLIALFYVRNMVHIENVVTKRENVEKNKMQTLFYNRRVKRSDHKSLNKKADQRKQLLHFDILKVFNPEDYLQRKQKKLSQLNALSRGIFHQNGELIYGLWRNTLFTRISQNQANRLTTNRLSVAAMFGQKVVIDLAFSDYVRDYGPVFIAKHLQLLYDYNRLKCEEAFDLHFTSCASSQTLMEYINKYMPHYKSPYSMASFHDKSYFEVFPKNKLVYISPHAKEAINTYNHDDIYVINPNVAESKFFKPVAYKQALSEGIRTVRLPIEYVLNSGENKIFRVNYTFEVLHNVRANGDWERALNEQFVPKINNDWQ